MTEDPKKNRRSIEDITADIEAISQDPDHRDQFKALRMLAAEKASSVVLPTPLNDHEASERLARLMRGYGASTSQIAYKRAFPNRKVLEEVVPKVDISHLSPVDKKVVESCRSLKSLYRNFPEAKRPGTPPGYPKTRGIGLQAEWCKKTAMKILLDREQAKMAKVESSDIGLGTQQSPVSGEASEGDEAQVLGSTSGDGTTP